VGPDAAGGLEAGGVGQQVADLVGAQVGDVEEVAHGNPAIGPIGPMGPIGPIAHSVVRISDRISQPSSSCSSVSVRAGSRRITVPCVQLTSSRRSMHFCTTGAPSTASSTPIIAPLTRT